MKEPLTLGIDHLGLTVNDIEKSLFFFVEVLGWSKVGGDPNYPAVYITDGYSKITLWQKKEGADSVFNRYKNIGLHHFALKVSTSQALKETYEKVKNWPGIEVEFSPEFSGKGPKEHFMVLEPGGTRLEFAYDPR